jgi:hypothetical protein
VDARREGAVKQSTVLTFIYIQATPACILFCNPHAMHPSHQQPKVLLSPVRWPK